MTDSEVLCKLWEYNYEIFRSSQNANAMEHLVVSAPTAECMIRAAERLFVLDPFRFTPGDEKQIKLLTSVMLWRSEICRLVHREKGTAFFMRLFLKSNDVTVALHIYTVCMAILSVRKYSRIQLAMELLTAAKIMLGNQQRRVTAWLFSRYIVEMRMQEGLHVVPSSTTDVLKNLDTGLYLFEDTALDRYPSASKFRTMLKQVLIFGVTSSEKITDYVMRRFSYHVNAVLVLGDDAVLKSKPDLVSNVLCPFLRNLLVTFGAMANHMKDSYELLPRTLLDWTNFVCLCVVHDVKIPDSTVIFLMSRLGLTHYQSIYDTMLKHVKYSGADASDFDTDWRAKMIVHLIHNRDWLPVSLGHEHPDAWASRIYKSYRGEHPPIPMDLPRPGDRVQRRATELPRGMDRPSAPEGNPNMQGTVRAAGLAAFCISVEVDGAPPASCWNFALWELECLDDCVVAKEVNKADWYKDTSGLEVIDLDEDEKDAAPKKKRKRKIDGPVMAYPVKAGFTGGSLGVAESGVRYSKVTLKLKT